MKAQIPLLVASVSVMAYASMASTPVPAAKADQPKALNFNRDVKPILSENCFKCHGPDAGVLAADLRLDSFASATKDRGGRRVIAVGKPEQSGLIKRISMKDGMRMPPPDSGHPALSEHQIDILTRWIAGGAKYEEHWSLVLPKKGTLPKVSDPAWCKNDIDRYVMARLDKEGLKPEAQADKATLLRRVALTLTGLPPTPQEIKAFLADNKPGAYERMVDRTLADPTYGEHQARFWLDALRYGDTHGLHLDNERSIYPFRDWVVREFNQDLPFDKFTLWQLAGDLLPNPTTEQLVATGYVRMNPTTSEGGAIEDEFLAKNTFDRVDTTSTIFLGMTVACARCHDHKYDPISQKDYYRLFAFFNSTADRPLDENAFLPPPVLRAATPTQEDRLKSMQASLDTMLTKVPQADALEWVSKSWKPVIQFGAWQVSAAFSGATFDEAHDKAFPPEDPAATVEWKPLDLKQGVITPVVAKENSSAYIRGTITSPKARELTIRVSSDDGIKVWINGKLVHNNKVLRAFNPIDTVTMPLNEGENKILFKISNGGGGDGIILYLSGEAEERLDKLHTAWTTGKPEDRKPAELAAAYLENNADLPLAKDYLKLKKDRSDYENAIPMTMIAREMEKPRQAYVLRRGEYNLPTDKVERAIPASLGRLHGDEPANRLGLAKWLISERNPLVSRVFVNRVWQQHFGTGIVKTAEDFGSQGEFPVDQPLLDYLAVTFREQGWSVKKLNRMIVTSAAFRQRAATSAAKLEKDPENRFASRGPRFRLDAEVIRDSALEASGLLRKELGGKGFRPYQPDGLWEAIAFADSTTARYTRDKGPGIYRRSLYLFWKRTSPHPVMLSFDAPMREACTVRRFRTNTPLQALVTMNEPMFVESSRVLAEKLIKTKRTDAQRLEEAYLLCLSRLPSDAERRILGRAIQRYRERYAADPADAEKLLGVGDSPRDPAISAAELASWALLCSTLLNTDEFLTQH